jgi:C-methyltransferase
MSDCLTKPGPGPRWRGTVLRLLQGGERWLELARRAFTPAPLTLFRDVTAPWLASALCVAARLRLADQLAEQPLPVAELARRVELSPQELARLLEVLRAHGYFQTDRQGRVRHSRLSRALRREVGGAFAELQGRGWYRQAFLSGHVLQGLRSRRTSFEVAQGQHFFDFLEEEPEARGLFAAAMDNVTRFCTPYLASEIELESDHRVLDIGGGNGELVRALAKRFPRATLAVLDRAPAAPRPAQEPSYTFHQGSFFEALPKGYNRLLLKNVLHDWGDTHCQAILARCREAVGVGDRLTVIECLLPERGQPVLGKATEFALDWNVWLTLSGQERSLSQLARLFEASGWRLERQTATATPYHLLDCRAL